MSSTIKDVAKMAGVSISTVSKFINGGNVLEENRQQIENAIATLNYQVNTVARGMKTRKTMSVGVLIPSLADYYGVSILSCIDQELYASGYSTIICDYSQTDPTGASDKINFLINKQIDGIIMQPINVRQEDIDRAAKADVPIVFLDFLRSPAILSRSITSTSLTASRNISSRTATPASVLSAERRASTRRMTASPAIPVRSKRKA